MSVSDLQADLKAGKTLAADATAKGKTVADLVSGTGGDHSAVQNGLKKFIGKGFAQRGAIRR
ncbi:MAG: hypothetical protein WCH31_00500 [Actinomycetes bacterium]